MGYISERFRKISLALLSLLLILVFTGIYYNYKYYAVQSVPEEFSANRKKILDQITSYYQNQEYTEARKLAQKYLQVQNLRLQDLYEKSREKELLSQIEALNSNNLKRELELWQKLAKLTDKETYKKKIEKQKKKIKEAKETKLLNQIHKISYQFPAQKALGYKRLHQLFPENAIYEQELSHFRQKVETFLQNSPWSDACSSTKLSYCQYKGYLAYLPEENFEKTSSPQKVGEILGVSWRPKGTLISKKGKTAPKNDYYYIISDSEKLFLYQVDYLQKKDPFSAPKVSAD